MKATASCSSITNAPPQLLPHPLTTSPNPKNAAFIPITHRHLIAAVTVTAAPFAPDNHLQQQHVASTRGLFQMPPVRLINRYYLVRAGESEYESWGVINTNPVAKTSVDSGLSEKGKKQTVTAAFDLKDMAFYHSESLSSCRDHCCCEWCHSKVCELMFD